VIILTKEEKKLRDTIFSYINLTKAHNNNIIRVLASLLNDFKKVK